MIFMVTKYKNVLSVSVRSVTLYATANILDIIRHDASILDVYYGRSQVTYHRLLYSSQCTYMYFILITIHNTYMNIAHFVKHPGSLLLI